MIHSHYNIERLKQIRFLKIYDIFESDGYKFSNKENKADKIIFLKSMPYHNFSLDKELDISVQNEILSILEQYECVVFIDFEHTTINSYLYLIEKLIENGKKIILNTFSVGIKHFLDKRFNNHNIYIKSISDCFIDVEKHVPFTNEFILNKKRKYLLKFFSYNRSPQRDYVFDFLIKNNLIENNYLSFHNHPFDVNESIDYKKLVKVNTLYGYKEAKEMTSKLDYELLNKLKIIPEAQVFNIQDQPTMYNKNMEANSDAYFSIISESHMPLSTDESNFFLLYIRNHC